MHYSLEAEAELISADERRDYSALNAVRLLCSDDSEAISAEGLRGKWTEYMKCQGKTDFITGVRLKSEPWKGWGKPSSQSTNREVKKFLKEHTTYFFYVYVSAKNQNIQNFFFIRKPYVPLAIQKI